MSQVQMIEVGIIRRCIHQWGRWAALRWAQKSGYPLELAHFAVCGYLPRASF